MLNLKNDILLGEELVTIDVNENNNYKAYPEYSSHIVRLYERKNGERYYVFFQVDGLGGYYPGESENGSYNDLQKYYFKSSWGKYIMNYNYEQYESLKKYIWIDNDIYIYGITGVRLGDKLEDKDENRFIAIAPSYRLKITY